MNYPMCMMVKQFIGKVRGNFCDFYVFTTGDPKYLLFSQLDPTGCATGLMIPTKKTDLAKDWKTKFVV